jgi:galactonate dehydratase
MNDVEDRTSKLKITSLRAFPVMGKCFLKIETSAGITGWGEVTGLDPKVAAALATSLFELLDGQNPTRTEYLWNRLYRSHRDMRGGPFMVHVLSGIDIALWDITGKAWGVPVYRLLGGPMRDKLRTYPNAISYKVPAGGPKRHSGTPQEVMDLVNAVKEARKRLGPSGTVMFDAHCCLPPPMLIQFANAVEPMDLLWIEEPAVPGDIEVFKRIKAAVKVPIATGERDRTIWEVLPYLQERCIDILQSDLGHCGGVTQLKKISTLAEAYDVPMAPHSVMSELGLSASFHVAWSIPNFLIHELNGGAVMPGVVKPAYTLDAEFNAVLNDAPGIGVEVDESLFEKANALPNRQYKWPAGGGQRHDDGSIADY